MDSTEVLPVESDCLTMEMLEVGLDLDVDEDVSMSLCGVVCGNGDEEGSFPGGVS